MVCIGATIGKCGYTAVEVTCNQQINALTPENELDYRFAYYQMLTSAFKRSVLNLAGQATLPIINKSKWASLIIHYPCITKQLEIIEKLNLLKIKSMELEANYFKRLEELTNLKKSILQKAFSGELTKDDKGAAA